MSDETDAGADLRQWLNWNHDAESDYDRVERGLAWLRELGPSYGCDVSRVDPKRINMQMAHTCILGQADKTGSYWVAMERIHGDEPWSDVARRAWAVAHGFWAHDVQWTTLTRVWREALAPEPQLTV